MGHRKDYLAKSIEDRFKEKFTINEQSGCWEWNKPQSHGYGLFKVNKKNRLAHRFSYYLFTATEPGALDVCHRCDNPKCVNPTHLFLGTHKDNMNDAQKKGRLPTAVCPSISKYAKGCRCEGCVAVHLEYGRNIRAGKERIYNKENGKLHCAKYYASNKEKIKAKVTAYRAENRDKINARRREARNLAR